jgi:hypothetical protein
MEILANGVGAFTAGGRNLAARAGIPLMEA